MRMSESEQSGEYITMDAAEYYTNMELNANINAHNASCGSIVGLDVIHEELEDEAGDGEQQEADVSSDSGLYEADEDFIILKRD